MPRLLPVLGLPLMADALVTVVIKLKNRSARHEAKDCGPAPFGGSDRGAESAPLLRIATCPAEDGCGDNSLPTAFAPREAGGSS